MMVALEEAAPEGVDSVCPFDVVTAGDSDELVG
jgi:hypothetical protein